MIGVMVELMVQTQRRRRGRREVPEIPVVPVSIPGMSLRIG
jgi:hypothetical protein